MTLALFNRFGVNHEKRIYQLRDNMRVIIIRPKADEKQLLKRDKIWPDMIRSVQTKLLPFPIVAPDCSLIKLAFVVE